MCSRDLQILVAHLQLVLAVGSLVLLGSAPPAESSPCVVTHEADNGDSVADHPLRRAEQARDGGAILYVDDDAAFGGDGLSWNTAYRFLQDARISAAASGGQVVEIRVAKGTHWPDRSELSAITPGDRSATFMLLNGVAWLGGFAGIGADDPDERDINLYQSVLSGDLVGANSYHVVRGSGVSATAVLDGFTITQGAATGGCCTNDRGAGMQLSGGGPTIMRCNIRSNLAANVAGGVWISDCAPVFVDCTFEDNVVTPGNGGAAIHNVFGSDLTLIRCAFVRNSLGTGSTGGGAIFVGGKVSASVMAASVTATDCIFVGNDASSGGAILNNGFADLTNCLFTGNAALGGGFGSTSGHGGAIANIGQITLTNCTLVANSATIAGAGLYTGRNSLNSLLPSWMVVRNTILWGNTAAQEAEANQVIVIGNSVLTLDHSCVEGLTGLLGGVGNIGADPQFVDGDGVDQIPGTEDDDLRLSRGSPCIDAGDSAIVPFGIDTDLDNAPRFRDDPATPDCQQAPGSCGGPPVVDIGAYELQPPCPSDLNGDGAVSEADLAVIVMNWGASGLGDLNDSGTIDGGDVGLLLGDWGTCP